MIPVEPQPEPAYFDREVRRKGLRYLQRKGFALDQPLPPGAHVEPHWRTCLDDLHRSYRGICAYLCVYIERIIGAASVDHFIAKSRRTDLIYEWSNYRLACATMNSRKLDYDDVLDPFEVGHGWFHLELVSGRIYPAPDLIETIRARVTETIERLKLDDPYCRETRAHHYQDYREGCYTADFLRGRSPLVWAEAERQGLL